MPLTGPDNRLSYTGERDLDSPRFMSPNVLGVLRFMISTGRIDHAATRAERARIADRLEYGDFPGVWGTIFMEVVKLHNAHAVYTEAEIAAAIMQYGIDAEVLREADFGPPSDDRVVQRYVDAMLEERAMSKVRNRIAYAAHEISAADQGHSPIRDIADFAERMATDLRQIVNDTPTDGSIEGFYFQMADIVLPARRDWVLSGMLCAEEVMIATAGGGIGKSDWGRTLAFAAENALDPLTGAPRQPSGQVRSLVVDVETQGANIEESANRLIAKVSNILGLRAEDVRQPALFARRGRLNLRDRAERSLLREMMRRVQPGFVVMGPLKNLFIEGDRESYATAALETQDILMNLMSDFECALYLEAHGSRGAKTETAGSQRWQDWPDMSVGLEQITEVPKTGSAEWIATVARWLDERKSAQDMLIKVARNREPRNTRMAIPKLLFRSATRSWPWLEVEVK